MNRMLAMTRPDWSNVILSEHHEVIVLEKQTTQLNTVVVLYKRVGLIFCSPFIGENECFLGNFKSY